MGLGCRKMFRGFRVQKVVQGIGFFMVYGKGLRVREMMELDFRVYKAVWGLRLRKLFTV